MRLYHFIKSKFIITPTNQLSFWRQYIYNDGYDEENRFTKQHIYKILDRFRKKDFIIESVSIESVFNHIYYPVFDIDDPTQLELFKKLYSPSAYAIFKSSTDHYWCILDNGFKNKKHIFYDVNWKICNDPKYVNFCHEYNKFLIRGIYENFERKPFLFETNGKFSKNFQSFIDKLFIYYNKEGLELSVLKYRDPSLLIKFNRKRKLQIINENN